MRYSPADIGQIVRTARKNMGATQRDLAMTSGTGMRFIVELEQGKATCQLGKVLTVLNTLGVVSSLVPPPPRKPDVSQAQAKPQPKTKPRKGARR